MEQFILITSSSIRIEDKKYLSIIHTVCKTNPNVIISITPLMYKDILFLDKQFTAAELLSKLKLSDMAHSITFKFYMGLYNISDTDLYVQILD